MTKIVLCGALFSLISLSAQDPAAIDKKLAEAKMQNDVIQVLGASMINGPTVKGAPYSAQVVNEMVQTLFDGNRITTSHSSNLYRDSQGRERREESSSGSNPTVRSIFITDPVEGVSYTLVPGSKIAHKMPQRQVGVSVSDGGRGEGAGAGRGLAEIKTDTRTFVMNSSGNGPETFFFSSQETNSSKAKPVVEHLGTQTIEGVSAEGTRTTVTIPAGQIGNEQPIVTVTERWYSPELQVMVMNKRTDPRTGTTTYKLTNINRTEPSPTMFEVPSDYKVIEPDNRRLIFNKFEDQR
jgi:hypothetical protein